MDARAAHRAERGDRARQLAFERAQAVHLLHEAGLTEGLVAVENLVADERAADALARHVEAELTDILARDPDLRPVAAQFEGRVLL
jgi:hypothetical protein